MCQEAVVSGRYELTQAWARVEVLIERERSGQVQTELSERILRGHNGLIDRQYHIYLENQRSSILIFFYYYEFNKKQIRSNFI